MAETDNQGNQTEKPVKSAEIVKVQNTGEKAAAKKGNWFQENKIIVALVAILAIFVVIAVLQLSQPPETVNPDDFHTGNGTVDSTVKFILIYSNDCPGCEIDGSFVLLLNKNGIGFAANKIEASTEDGKRIIGELGITKLPVALVDGESISQSMIVRSDDKLQISTPNGTITLRGLLELLARKYPTEVGYDIITDIFVLPELGLDGGRHTDYLLGTEECLPENPAQMFAKVDLFVDPYGTPYIKSTETVNFYRDYYSGRMDFDYHYLPIDASKNLFPADMPKGNIETMARYFACADEQGFLQKTENAFYARYCGSDDNNVLDPPERANCADSDHYGFPVLGDESALIASLDLEFDEGQFAECLSGLGERFSADSTLAEQLQIKRVPTAVINCKYSTHTINIDKALCKLDPEMEHCEFFR
ncbi:MAG: hypothetical protein CL943_03720 [Candidatus Diapherotrites archaeon]|uniref:Thioredoxin domain-containing protein n=1 Tax=Candidatus Iainarchaeum sp. TaxID=3101447 RepID=A0A2D6M1S6_9ARCH|nr:hypothetical protein [Candidatus Diapherotrites archaeon]|tara:strand:+ start:537 stop:1793 length:1257 start_codon:yes stop_codon:yes gene_type:complete